MLDLLVDVVVEAIVAAERDEGTETKPVREEHLRHRVYPHLRQPNTY